MIVINDLYEVIEEIGQGGGGIVYKAYHKNLQKYVVLKQIKDTTLTTAESRNEVDLLKNLKHTYLPQVLDFIEYNGAVYTVMDYIDGSDLAKCQRGKPLKTKEIIRYSTQLCEAVKYLHAQKPPIVHGDIKPENIMVTPEGNICLIDFNISLLFDNNAIVTGFTRGFAAPEQVGWDFREKINNTALKNKQYCDPTEKINSTEATEKITESSTNNTEIIISNATEKTEILKNNENGGELEEIAISSNNYSKVTYDNLTERTELLNSSAQHLPLDGQEKTELLFEGSANASPEATEILLDGTSNKHINSNSVVSSHSATVRSDIYSIGAVLYYMITGVAPASDFSSITPIRDFKPNVPEGLIIIAEKAMNVNPSKRYSTADSMFTALNNVMKLDRRYQSLRFQRIIASIVCFIGLLVSAFSVRDGYKLHNQERQDKYDALIFAAEEAIRGNNYESASEYVQSALSYMPDKPEAYYENLLILYEKGDYSGCIGYYNANERLFSESVFNLKNNMYYTLANAYFENEDYSSSILNFNKALSIDSGYSMCYRDLAISYARTAQIDKASDILSMAIAANVSNDQIDLMKGEIEIARNDYKNAFSYIECAVNETEDDYLLYRGLKKYIELCDNKDNGIANPHLSAIQLLLENQSRVSVSYIDFIYEMLANQYTYLGRESGNYEYYNNAIDYYKSIMSNPAQKNAACRNCYELQYQLKDLSGCLETLGILQLDDPNNYWISMNYAYVLLEMQAENSYQARDYYAAYQHYKKAKALYEKEMKNGKSDPNMQALDKLFDKLIEENWIKPEWRV